MTTDLAFFARNNVYNNKIYRNGIITTIKNFVLTINNFGAEFTKVNHYNIPENSEKVYILYCRIIYVQTNSMGVLY